MEHLKNWLTHNTVLKLFSLLLGFLVWIVVVNTSNPKVSGSVSVPFDVYNEKDESSSSELYTLNYSAVTVSYDVRSKYKAGINSDSFKAYVDMDDYSEESEEIPVYLETDSSVSGLIANVKLEPSSVHVYKEKIQQKKFAVQYEVLGQVASGYAMGDISITPEYTYIKGPLSIMGQISSVGITITVEGLTDTVEGISTIEFYDANGNELAGIENSLSFAGDITYTVPVYRIKTLTVNAFTGGAPASGYAVESVETNPTFISVYGPEEILAENSYILIPSAELNISGITENMTFNISAANYIPEGLKLVEPQTEITILVKVKNIQKESDSGGSEKNEPAESTDVPAETETELASEALSILETAAEGEINPGEADTIPDLPAEAENIREQETIIQEAEGPVSSENFEGPEGSDTIGNDTAAQPEMTGETDAGEGERSAF